MEFSVRQMQAADLDAVERIFRLHEAGSAIDSWTDRVVRLLDAPDSGIALVATTATGEVAGYLVGEVRVWEFGSNPSGWIFAAGVDPALARQGLGTLLRDEAVHRFAELGVGTVRTMVKKDDVRVLRFFRSGGFRAGPYVELELDFEQQQSLPGGGQSE